MQVLRINVDSNIPTLDVTDLPIRVTVEELGARILCLEPKHVAQAASQDLDAIEVVPVKYQVYVPLIGTVLDLRLVVSVMASSSRTPQFT